MGAEHAFGGNYKSACTMFRGVLIHEPHNFEAMSRLGAALFELRQIHEAFYWFWRVKKMAPRNPMALTNYGLTLSQLGHWDEALPDLERAVNLAEQYGWKGEQMALVYNNLGNTYERLKRHKEALAILNKGIEQNPDDPFPWYNRGIALMRLNRHREAVGSLDRSITLRNKLFDGSGSRLSEPDAIYNRGMAHLLLGNFRDGWEGYEARLTTTENKSPNLGLPVERKWIDQDIKGKYLLVHAEQGLGDTMQFLRFVPALADRGAHIYLVTHREIWPLVTTQYPNIEVLKPGKSVPHYDYWVALMSLPLRLGIDTEDKIKAWPPWLPHVEHARVVKWQADLALPDDKLNVGICWAGNFQHKNDEHRSIPLEKFAKGLLGTPNVNFVSLQQMAPEDTHEFPKYAEQYGNVKAYYLGDFRDTAAIIFNLDYVVSVDTSVAHLAATMRKPTMVLVPAYSTDWRWQIDRDDSPWYPELKIFRQPKIGDWKTALERLSRDLSNLAQFQQMCAVI